ncbi:response regulator [Robertmurraya kyonggiensis]|uniref:Response regulator n=1 Tax=Robertmurraya kyonggiensis TaxID=1037680 RepID=A0A4U1D0E0_9BACI|nr:response regulator [Robertmurraya kyonggiensis]TKC13850.1 response regulator [Robertmurraya kyonggiensis]
MIRVLIVEDDPMVAELNKRYLESIEGFQAAAIASSVKDAKHFLASNEVELILLDVYMPGDNGLTLLAYIRESDFRMDVILITAASDIKTIQSALRFGTIDYLIKPFTFTRLKEALIAYQQKVEFLGCHSNQINQQELDEILLQKEKLQVSLDLPKGLTKHTLSLIWDELKDIGEQEFSTLEIAKRTGITRVSIRKYLNFLEDIGVLETNISYGAIGRPISKYVYNESNDSLISDYL